MDHLCVHHTFRERGGREGGREELSCGTASESKLALFISIQDLSPSTTVTEIFQYSNRILTMAPFRVAAEPKMIHSKADIGPATLYLLFQARMIVQTDSSVQETFDLLATPC